MRDCPVFMIRALYLREVEGLRLRQAGVRVSSIAQGSTSLGHRFGSDLAAAEL